MALKAQLLAKLTKFNPCINAPFPCIKLQRKKKRERNALNMHFKICVFENSISLNKINSEEELVRGRAIFFLTGEDVTKVFLYMLL